MVQDDVSSSVTSSSPLQSFSMLPISPTPAAVGSPYHPWLRRDLNSDERGLYLIHLLLNCAAHVAASSLDGANALLDHISLLASPDGDAMQRVASHFTSALACRLLRRSWPGLYRALHLPAAASPLAGAALARRHFLDLLPFLRLASAISNQAILEAMEGEKVVHVVDLDAADPTQWVGLLHSLSALPGGPPHLRITGVHAQRETLHRTAMILSDEADKLDVSFQFDAVVSSLEELTIDHLRVKTGEALGVSSVLQLHCLLASDDDNSLSSPPKIKRFLASMRSLSPKIMVVTEQESDHNAPAMSERFTESLNYYAALFDCMESTVGRGSTERMRVEEMVFGEEIKSIIACEGSERKERHERLEKWVRRLETAGFARVRLGCYPGGGVAEARRLLERCGCEGYRVREESNGCFVICWQDRALFSISAWRCRKFD